MTPSARDVVLAALATTLPATDRPDTEARADLVVAALIEYGHLPGPEHVVTPADVAEAAQWLADKSGHPRYLHDSDAWTKLLQSEHDVVMAAAQANSRAGTASELTRIGEVRTLLTDALARAKRAEEKGDRDH